MIHGLHFSTLWLSLGAHPFRLPGALRSILAMIGRGR